MTAIYDFEATLIDGQVRRLDAFRGQVLLVANVASQCGFTPQYAALEALYRKYQPRGFAVLAFPCNQFGRQEPGSEADIKSFCATTYDVSFPLFAKVDVNGAAAHPLFRYLKSARRGFLGTSWIKWNFTKFLVDRHGSVVGRYFPTVSVERIEHDLLPLLADPALPTSQPAGKAQADSVDARG